MPGSGGPLCQEVVDHCARKWWTTVPERGESLCQEVVDHCAGEK